MLQAIVDQRIERGGIFMAGQRVHDARAAPASNLPSEVLTV